MIDSVQLVLLFVIIVLTILLVVLGVQVFFILREVKRTLSKANRVLDTADVITEAMSGPLSSIGNLGTVLGSGTFATVAKVIKVFLHRAERKNRHDERE